MSTEVGTFDKLREHGETAKNFIDLLTRDAITEVALLILGVFFFLGIFGPALAPHDPFEYTVATSSGEIMRLSPPNSAAPMGTTSYGKDILSRFLEGARPTFVVGFFGGVGIGVLGFLVGLTSGYFGGWVDEVLMRLTDLTFSLPFLPLALFILTFIESSVSIMILILVLHLWKIPARVVRSEVLTIKQRTFVKSARASGASHFRTMFWHVAPSALPVGFLYTAYAVFWSIGSQAALAFLGFGDPTTTSWGRMLHQVFQSGAMREAWWWVLPPSLAIAAVTSSVFLVGRAMEEVINPEIKTKGEVQ